jgi:hypothetical protein
MNNQSFTISVFTDKTPAAAFDAINNISGWWTENVKGNSQKLEDEFEVRFGDVHYSKQKITALVPDKEVVWLITDSQLNFITNKQEWTGTKIIFEITAQDNKTQVRFTHMGLVQQYECFNACSNAWSQFIQQSLLSLINTGKGQPSLKENKAG